MEDKEIFSKTWFNQWIMPSYIALSFLSLILCYTMMFTSYSRILCYFQMGLSIPVLVMTTKFAKSTLIKAGILGLFMVLILSDGVDISMVNTMIMLVILSQYPFDRTIKIYVSVTFITILVFTFLYYMGIVSSTDNIRDGVLRISYGFNHANIYAQFILAAYLGYIYLRNFQIRYFDILLGIGLAVWIYIGCNSRTSCLLALAGSILAMVCKWFNYYYPNGLDIRLFRLG